MVDVKTFWVALGGNVPLDGEESEVILRQSLLKLAQLGCEIVKESRYFATPCFPAGAGPDYVNAVAEIRCAVSVEDFLGMLHKVECMFGRERKSRWAGRTLDLDLIACGEIVAPDVATAMFWINLPLQQQRQQAPDQLILPHPRIQDRAFVLVPLCDVAPDWRHPVLGKTARQMLEELPETARNEVVPL